MKTRKTIDANGMELWRKMVDGEPGDVVSNDSNALAIVRDDPRLKGRIAYDELGWRVIVTAPLPWDRPGRVYPRQWLDSDTTNLSAHIDDTYGVSMRKYINAAVETVAEETRINPVAEYLDGLEWDGVERVATLFLDVLGADPGFYDATENPNKSFAGEAARLWLQGAWFRAHIHDDDRPVQFDYLLALCGPQGVGKSTLLRRLAHNIEWSNESFSTLAEPQASENLRGKWIIEMPENLAIKRSDTATEALKSFVTRVTDTYRTPYSRYTQSHQRRCVLATTTNEEEFMPYDPSGYRRWLPINCGIYEPIYDMWDDPKAFDYYVDQIWAEIGVSCRYMTNPALVLSKDAVEYLGKHIEEHVEDNPRELAVASYLDDARRNGTTTVNVQMILDCAMDTTMAAAPAWLVKEIKTIMDARADWTPYRGSKNHRARVRGYGMSKAWEFVG